MNDRIGICIILSLTIICVTYLVTIGGCKATDPIIMGFFGPIGLALVGGLTGISRGEKSETD